MDLPKYIFVHKSSDDVFTNHIVFQKSIEVNAKIPTYYYNIHSHTIDQVY